MGYEAGIIVNEQDVLARDSISKYYQEQGDSFSADYIYEYGNAYNICGYAFADLTADFHSRRSGIFRELDEFGEESEYDIIPIAEFLAVSRDVSDFLESEGGRKMQQAAEEGLYWEVGEDEDDDGHLFISPEMAHEAFEKLHRSGYGRGLERVLDSGYLPTLLEMGKIAEIAADAGVDELGWYESY